jgi:alanine racemase
MEAKHFPGGSRLLISRSALLHNVAVIRKSLRPLTKVCAMVKADAYGHGAWIVADTLANFVPLDGREGPAVDAFAVATVEEAVALPKSDLPVLIFQPVENALIGQTRRLIELAIRNRWVLTLCSKSAADDVARIAVRQKRRAQVQVMIDTGLARSGASLHRAGELLEKIHAWPSLRLAGVCTHFASSEAPGDLFTGEQLAGFCELTDPLAGKAVRHAANSGGVFFWPASHLDLVRPGISIYGIDPTGTPSSDRPLRPVMKWVSPLVGVREIPKGTSVGYNQTWRAERDTRIGLLPIGYADGYLRCFSNRAVMLVHGRPAPVVGRVSMDCLTIDLGDIPQAGIGDDVTVLDDDPISPASAYALAELAGTIPYEVFCRIGSRVKRIAVDPEDGQDVIGSPGESEEEGLAGS